MKSIITFCFLLFGTLTVHAQEALRSYTAEMNRIERLADEAQKSTERGKALAVFFDSRNMEAGKQTAVSEVVPYMRKLVDYDFYGAYNFFLKVKNLDDAKMLMQNYLSKDEQTLVRAFASNTVNNWKSGGQNPVNAPQKGSGLKGKWTASAGSHTTPSAVSPVITQTENGNADLAKGNEAEKAQNYAEAMKWYKLSADKGNAKAMYNVGFMYYHSRGVAQNYAEAMNWFKKSADKGIGPAMFNIGAMYYNGLGVAKNDAEAKTWFQKAADKGDEDARQTLQKLAAQTDNGSADFKKANEAFDAKNYAEALNWYKKAADKGNTNAMYNIGTMYQNGNGVNSDGSEAVKWYKISADKGNVTAKKYLQELDKDGRVDLYKATEAHDAKNYADALKWYKLSADKGNMSAVIMLRVLEKEMEMSKIVYGEIGKPEFDKGVEAEKAKNYTEAFKWYKQSADKGNPEAMYYVGLYYHFGTQGPTAMPNNTEAKKWFKQSADTGNTDAMFELGKLYMLVDKNNTEAYSWFKKAADKGHSAAKTYLALVKK